MVRKWTAGANKGDISVVKSEVDKSRPVIATYTPFGNKNLTKIEEVYLTFASQIVKSKTDIFTDKGNYLSMKQKFDINIKNFLWKDYLTKDIQVDDERIASVTLSLSDEAKTILNW